MTKDILLIQIDSDLIELKKDTEVGLFAKNNEEFMKRKGAIEKKVTRLKRYKFNPNPNDFNESDAADLDIDTYKEKKHFKR